MSREQRCGRHTYSLVLTRPPTEEALEALVAGIDDDLPGVVGYASALTAALSERLMDTYHFCFLFTDLANPTANRIYERIGYRRVCEAAEIAFEPN